MPDKKNDAQGSQGKGRYALDAGDLLGGILSETQDEAAQEEERLKAQLDERVEAERRAREEEAERKKREVEAALSEERKRQEAAQALRSRVQRVVEELEHETASGALNVVEELEPMSGRQRLDYATNVRASQSYAHPAVSESRRTWLLAAMALTIVLLLGGGATAAVLLLSGPSVDPNSYPKTSVNLEGVTNNGAVTVALNMVPEPEPVVDSAAPGEDVAETASADRGRDRHRDRDRDRDRDDDDDSGRTAPLDISLDGSGIFDRGSE